MTNEIETIIKQYGLHANKKLGQHFLTDPYILDNIVSAAHMAPRTHIIEIGPGPGGLTRAILASDKCVSLTAIELDARCIPALHAIDDARLDVMQEDALSVALKNIASPPRAVIANLPYNIGTELLMRWLEEVAHDTRVVDSITVMLQQEVALRLCAQPGDKLYGRLAIMMQWLGEVHHCLNVPPDYFSPPPKVMSSVIRFAPHSSPRFTTPYAKLTPFLNAAFAQRRKMLRTTLKSWCDDPIALIVSCNIDPTRRAETLTLEEIDQLIIAYHTP